MTGSNSASGRRGQAQLLARGAFVVAELRPWHENAGGRPIKVPKVYMANGGMLHALQGIAEMRDLPQRPKLGASWAGFPLAQAVQRSSASRDECLCWATYAGAEPLF